MMIHEWGARIVKSTVRTALVASLVVVALCGIVSVEAQTPNNGQGNSIISAQNKNTDVGNPDATANIVASYVNPAGSPADSVGGSVPPLAAAQFLSSDAGVGEAWVGSMVLYSDEQLASSADLMWENGAHGDGKTAASYTGFGEGSDTWYLPRVVVAHGAQVTSIALQNADTQPVTVTIKYVYRGDATPTAVISETIETAGSRLYDLGDPGGKVPDLTTLVGQPTWEGAAVVEVEDGRVVTAMCVFHWRGFAAAYVAVPQPALNILGPRLLRRAYDVAGELNWAEFGNIFLQNPNDTDADVDVAFYDVSTGNLDLLLEVVVPAHRMRSINLRQGGHIPVADLDPLDSDPGPDIVWSGKVLATSDIPILGVVLNQRGWEVASMYGMADTTQGSDSLYMPSVYRVLGAGAASVYSRLIVANLSDTAPMDIDWYFYDRDGNQDLVKHHTVLADGVKNLQTQLSPFTSLGNNWEGSVYVTSTGPMVGIVDTLWVAGSVRMSTYDAIGN